MEYINSTGKTEETPVSEETAERENACPYCSGKRKERDEK